LFVRVAQREYLCRLAHVRADRREHPLRHVSVDVLGMAVDDQESIVEDVC
jgi:hypothetical protein